ncbi:uncharacterized protein FOMMEDRAFT_131691 [Fomitiporia mediterranea MF3/22]|uniref:uncharacterized protein n=1 Tax=Fomitiporia mediterranea (strain MF3/22) TaxID=694068 RepID=UPI0004408691|nr:uncharacterized protein FOMMEDRAFT_131691 [Fomitiporia mediterranea MF3/22]EJD06891.1 hypothetical protein FOMMEDRAFT_131691 [Fomitiporia mediterranea MF3/22]
MSPLSFAYYCSGHGYGHATRVSAVAAHLRQLQNAPTVHIVSSAPCHVFDLAISCGAHYRYAEIDPVIVQPLAYYVDRRKSVEILKSFLQKKERKIAEEVTWLKDNAIDCVLSDAAFLACKAANVARIPSVLITNFTFDSVYSYLSIRFPEGSPLNPKIPAESFDSKLSLLNDDPIPPEELAPLVRELLDGYRCAELLLRLPGNIPMPSFCIEPTLPSYLWTEPERNRFLPDVLASLSQLPSSEDLHPSTPFPSKQTSGVCKSLPRRVVQAPLIVRHPSEDIYTPIGRKRLLDTLGVPEHLQTPETKILVVSFGGQVFRRPHSHTPSRSHSPTDTHSGSVGISHTPSTESLSSNGSASNAHANHYYHHSAVHARNTREKRKEKEPFVHVVSPIATESHIWVPGAPPANKTPTVSSFPRLETLADDNDSDYDSVMGTPLLDSGSDYSDSEVSESVQLQRFLPDNSWVAIVCGGTATSSKTCTGGGRDNDNDNDELPKNFFIAPQDVYMPDLTALADVLLGKLGYGTTAECVDACTPFVFVPRPLFVEEHGLRRLLQEEGAGVELSCERYEAGDWADAVKEAWEAGKELKKRKRAVGDDGVRKKQGMNMARELVAWVREWQDAEVMCCRGEGVEAEVE